MITNFDYVYHVMSLEKSSTRFIEIYYQYQLYEVDNWNKFDVLDYPGLYEDLYDLWHHEMPYGTMKGRDGDPVEWINRKLLEEI